MKITVYYAEVCAQIDGEQQAIWIGPFYKKTTNGMVFEAARMMCLKPVETCKPNWKLATYECE